LAYSARVKTIVSAVSLPALLALALAFPLALLGCASDSPPATDAAASDSPITRDVGQPDAVPDRTVGIADEAPGPSDTPAQQEAKGPDTSDAASTGDVGMEAAGDLRVPAIDLASDGSAIDVAIDLAIEARSVDGQGGEAGGEAGCSGWTTLKHLSPADLADLLATSDPIVINVHTPYEGDIPGTDTSIPYDHIKDIDTYLHGDRCADVVLICKSGSMSQTAGNDLIKLGYLRVRDLDGGMRAWETAGYPLLKDGGI